MKQTWKMGMLLMAAAVLLAGCEKGQAKMAASQADSIFGSEKDSETEKASESNQNAGNAMEADEKTGKTASEKPAEKDYAVVPVTVEEENIAVSYPQITNMKDEKIQEKWNAIIKSGVEASLKDWDNSGQYEETYTVKTQNEELLSILMEGSYYGKDAAYPYYFQYTYNINMVTGENIRLADYLDVDAVAEALMSGKGYTVSEELAKDFKERLEILHGNAAQLAAALKEYDYNGVRGAAYGYSYIEEGKTHLCMEVPHALGDYADVTLELAEMEEEKAEESGETIR